MTLVVSELPEVGCASEEGSDRHGAEQTVGADSCLRAVAQPVCAVAVLCLRATQP